MKEIERSEILARSPLFKGVPAEEIPGLLKKIRCRVKRFDKGCTVAFRGQPCDELLILLQGKVRAEMVDAGGKAVQIEFIPAPRPLIGHPPAPTERITRYISVMRIIFGFW